MAENNPIKSRREQHVERLRTKYPDKNFEDEDELFGQISDDYDQYDKKIAENQSREKAFSDMFHSNPRSARLMMEWKDGKDPVASLIRIYGKEEILAAIEDPARLEAIEEANKEFAENVAKNDEYDAQYEKNFPESVAALDTWMQESGIPEEAVDKAVVTLTQICGDFILGKFTPDTIEMIMKAQNYDTDVASSRKEGEVAGRNAKIVEKMRNSKKGDGINSLNGRNGTPGQSERPKSVFDLAREAD